MIYARSPLTDALYTALRNANGDVSYDALCAAAGGMALDDIRQSLAAARRYLERDEGIVYATIRGKGLRRLSDAEKVDSAEAFTRTIYRTAGRGSRRLDAVHDFSALPNEQQLAATLRRTVFETVRRETRVKA